VEPVRRRDRTSRIQAYCTRHTVTPYEGPLPCCPWESRGRATRFAPLEARRLRAADLPKGGLPEAEVGRRVGVHRQRVNQRAQQLATQGRSSRGTPVVSGVRHAVGCRSPAGRTRVAAGSRAGHPTGWWTAWRVADLIKRECEVEYHPGHAWRLVKQFGVGLPTAGRPRPGAG
jgi:transposase